MAGAGVTFLLKNIPLKLTAFAPREVVRRFREEWVLEDSNYEFSGAFAVSFYLCKLCYKHIQ